MDDVLIYIGRCYKCILSAKFRRCISAIFAHKSRCAMFCTKRSEAQAVTSSLIDLGKLSVFFLTVSHVSDWLIISVMFLAFFVHIWIQVASLHQGDWVESIRKFRERRIFHLNLISSFCTCHNLCFDLFISVLSLFAFSALALALQLFGRKHCLLISGPRMCSVTWNRSIIKNLLVDWT